MNSKYHPHDPQEWTELHFGGLDLKDARRNARAKIIAQTFAEYPELSIPQAFTRAYDVKAAYCFFDMETSTPENLQSSHKEVVYQALKCPGVYLLIEDGSEFNWSNESVRTGLGAMHKGYQGFVMQTVLAVKWQSPKAGKSKRQAVEVIGIAHQEYYARVPRPEGEGNNDTKSRQKRPRESQLWERSGITLGKAPQEAEIRWVRIADRGADITFFLRDCQSKNHGFVVRAAQNRRLVNQPSQGLEDKLFEVARNQEVVGSFDLELRARPGQAARTARLSLSYTSVRLQDANNPVTKGQKQGFIECTVVRVWEAQPPHGVEALEWILLSDKQPESLQDALEIAIQYASRWLIEEFHKCLKTGLRADDLQLETAERLFAAISIKSVVALRLLDLREAVRFNHLAKANTSGLSLLELQVLSSYLKRELKTVEDVALAIGRLGGHMNRKGDGLPGWQSLWKGMQRLSALVEGVNLARSFGTYG